MEDESIYQVKRSIIIKIEDNKTYQNYAQIIVKEVPEDDMKLLLNLFLNRASTNMGILINDNMAGIILEFIYKEFCYLPVFYIGSGIMKGSLGQYGAGRLVPRTIYGWLNEVSQEYDKYQDHQKYKKIDYLRSFDLNKYPFGQAIIQKIKWYKEGKLQSDDWDKINLESLTEAIARKEKIEFEDFYK